jgi:hypothetical protein
MSVVTLYQAIVKLPPQLKPALWAAMSVIPKCHGDANSPRGSAREIGFPPTYAYILNYGRTHVVVLFQLRLIFNTTRYIVGCIVRFDFRNDLLFLRRINVVDTRARRTFPQFNR